MTRVGIVGVGAMGGAMAANLLQASFDVGAFDIDPDRLATLRDQGATPASSPGQLAVAADVLITSLPSIAAFEQVVAGEDGISSVDRTDLVVVEASTLPIAVKTRGRDILARRGITLLDCH